MRVDPDDELHDVAAVKDLVRQYPWCTFVSPVPGTGLVASHYPVLLDEDDDGIVLLSHMGRPDEVEHRLGEHEMLAIVQGPQGYISPGWYGYRPNVPTWDFAVAHLHGVAEILPDRENLAVLDRLVSHFESRLDDPHLLHATQENSEYAQRIVTGTVGFRMRITRFRAREKMSQDKPAEAIRGVVAALRGPGPYRNRVLADRIEDVNSAKLAHG